MSKFRNVFVSILVLFFFVNIPAYADQPAKAEPEKTKSEKVKPAAASEDKLPWWPTDAQPGPVKDDARGGYWWWPSTPGSVKDLWGNRGYAYVNKIIYNWHDRGQRNVKVTVNDVGFVETEPKPSLLIKRTIRELNLYFKDNNAEIEPGHAPAFKKVLASLQRNPAANILITGNAPAGDTTGLADRRAAAVEKYMLDQGIAKERIKVLAPGKLQESGFFRKQKGPGGVEILVVDLKEVMIPGPKGQ